MSMQSAAFRLTRRIKLDTVGGNFPKPNEICNIIIISFFSSNYYHRTDLMALRELTGLTGSAQPPPIHPPGPAQPSLGCD